MTTDDVVLVQNYAQTGSEEAFSTLVSRHVPKVRTAEHKVLDFRFRDLVENYLIYSKATPRGWQSAEQDRSTMLLVRPRSSL